MKEKLSIENDVDTAPVTLLTDHSNLLDYIVGLIVVKCIEHRIFRNWK